MSASRLLQEAMRYKAVKFSGEQPRSMIILTKNPLVLVNGIGQAGLGTLVSMHTATYTMSNKSRQPLGIRVDLKIQQLP
jgi:hypothetical protein